MAGSRTLRRRGGRFAAAFAVSFLASASAVRRKVRRYRRPGCPSAAPPGSSGATQPPPVVFEAGPVMQPTYRPAPAPSTLPADTPVVMGLFDTIRASIFEDPNSPNAWRPLSLGTFFSEGWNEPWAGGPAGQSGLTPRHGWLGAFEGVFYRLWLVDAIYQNNLSKPFGGNGYKGDFGIFLPFSRRFELFVNVPFVTANGTEDPNRGYRSDFGDMTIAAGFLLSETKSFTQLATLAMIVPTGQTETGGNLMTLFPRYSFWSNPGGAWVVRGGMGFNVPLNKNDQEPAPVFTPDGGVLFGESTSQTNYNAALAVGRYFTPHDVPFGDLVLYANATSSSRSRMTIGRLTSGSAPARGSRSPATGGSCITGRSR